MLALKADMTVDAKPLKDGDTLKFSTVEEVRAARKAIAAFMDAFPALFNKPPPEVDLTEPTDGELVTAYIELDDKYKTVKKNYDIREAQYKDRLKAVQAELLRRQTAQGTTQIKVAGVGLAYQSTKMVASCADWDVFFNWSVTQIQKALTEGTDPTAVFAFFQKRLTIDTVKHFMENNEGGVPPAVNTMTEYTVTVRRDKN